MSINITATKEVAKFLQHRSNEVSQRDIKFIRTSFASDQEITNVDVYVIHVKNLKAGLGGIDKGFKDAIKRALGPSTLSATGEVAYLLTPLIIVGDTQLHLDNIKKELELSNFSIPNMEYLSTKDLPPGVANKELDEKLDKVLGSTAPVERIMTVINNPVEKPITISTGSSDERFEQTSHGEILFSNNNQVFAFGKMEEDEPEPILPETKPIDDEPEVKSEEIIFTSAAEFNDPWSAKLVEMPEENLPINTQEQAHRLEDAVSLVEKDAVIAKLLAQSVPYQEASMAIQRLSLGIMETIKDVRKPYNERLDNVLKMVSKEDSKFRLVNSNLVEGYKSALYEVLLLLKDYINIEIEPFKDVINRLDDFDRASYKKSKEELAEISTSIVEISESIRSLKIIIDEIISKTTKSRADITNHIVDNSPSHVESINKTLTQVDRNLPIKLGVSAAVEGLNEVFKLAVNDLALTEKPLTDLITKLEELIYRSGEYFAKSEEVNRMLLAYKAEEAVTKDSPLKGAMRIYTGSGQTRNWVTAISSARQYTGNTALVFLNAKNKGTQFTVNYSTFETANGQMAYIKQDSSVIGTETLLTMLTNLTTKFINIDVVVEPDDIDLIVELVDAGLSINIILDTVEDEKLEEASEILTALSEELTNYAENIYIVDAPEDLSQIVGNISGANLPALKIIPRIVGWNNFMTAKRLPTADPIIKEIFQRVEGVIC